MGLFKFGNKKKTESPQEVKREKPDGIDLLEFMLDNNHCAAPVSSIREICQYEKLIDSGLEHRSIEGVFYFRNRPVAVIDLKLYIGMRKSEPAGMLIVLNTSGRDLAVHVTGVIGVDNIDRSTILRSPGAPDYVLGAVKIMDEPTAVFDLDYIAADVLSV